MGDYSAISLAIYDAGGESVFCVFISKYTHYYEQELRTIIKSLL